MLLRKVSLSSACCFLPQTLIWCWHHKLISFEYSNITRERKRHFVGRLSLLRLIGRSVSKVSDKTGFKDCENQWSAFKVASSNIYAAKQSTLRTSLCLQIGLRLLKSIEFGFQTIHPTPAAALCDLLSSMFICLQIESSLTVCLCIVV